MTAPIFMAAPPEVHSALLSTGPGPGPLLAAAGTWNSLSAEYASVAEGLSALLAQVQAGAWQGPTAEAFVAAHGPYLAWLAEASANSAAAAAEHEAVAAAYATALAAMPTLPELATNHVVHAVLVATNFFGINTIPIALNEADYVRMWIQAASTMSIYQVVSNEAVAATPQTDPSPVIVKSDTQTDSAASSAQSATETPLDQLIVQLLQARGITWDPTAGTINGLPYSAYTQPLTQLYLVKNTVTFIQSIEQFVQLLETNPEAALATLTPANIAAFFAAHPVVAAMIASAPLLALSATPAVTVAAAVGAVAGPVHHPGVALPAAAPPLALSAALPAPTITSPGLPAATSTPATQPATPAPAAPTSAAPASPPPPTAPPPVAAHGFGFPYLMAVGGGPGIGFDSGAATRVAASTKLRAPAESAALAGAAAARRRARKRRHQQAYRYDFADEFADMNVDVQPPSAAPAAEGPVGSAAASDRGTGQLGFAGTVRHDTVTGAAGLATLKGDGFGGGPDMPMLPGTWGTAQPREEDQDS
jgi:PPE-repeat protein